MASVGEQAGAANTVAVGASGVDEHLVKTERVYKLTKIHARVFLHPVHGRRAKSRLYEEESGSRFGEYRRTSAIDS